jgi:hypothetical protein
MVAGNRDTPRPYRPDDGVTLVGPFWTRIQVAGLLGRTPLAVAMDHTLLRIDGPMAVEEVYPAFQFGNGSVRREVVFLSRLLKRRVSDVEACDWLMRPRRSLDGRTPVAWVALDGDVDRVMRILPAPSRPVPGPGGAADSGGAPGSAVPVTERGRRRWAATPLPH